MLRTAIVIGLSLVLLSCATKHYGRQGILSTYEKETMSCREIDLEIAKVRGFIDGVNKESEFSGRDVLAVLGDFGIGNALEKSAVIESANNRLDALQKLKNTKHCKEDPT